MYLFQGENWDEFVKHLLKSIKLKSHLKARPLKSKDDRNPMKMTTTVGKHRFGKGDMC